MQKLKEFFVLKTVIDFFISTWLWAITWGIYHVPVNIFVMFFLLKFVGKFKIVPSVLLAFFSKIFAVTSYSLIVFLIVKIFGLKFIPEINVDNAQAINILLACISVGIIYSILQSLFFFIINKFYSINLRITILISFVSNIATALFIYRFLEIN
jgi:hypothetical protein